MIMSIVCLVLGVILAGALVLLTRELHDTEKLVQKLEQYAANERRPQHGRTIHTNYEEDATQPVHQTISDRLMDMLNNKK